MIVISGASENINGDLDDAADPNVTCMAFYEDYDHEGKLVDVGAKYTAFSGTTDVNLVAAPGADKRRVVKSLHIYNADDANSTVTVWWDDGTNEPVLFKAVMATLTHLYYEQGYGWKVLSATGQLSTLAPTS